MHKQPIHSAICTADLLAGLGLEPEEPKGTWRDLLTSAGQVATALSFCWVLHVLV